MVFEVKNMLATFKRGGGNIMIWRCCAAASTGKIVLINGTMDPGRYQAILNGSVSWFESWISVGARTGQCSEA